MISNETADVAAGTRAAPGEGRGTALAAVHMLWWREIIRFVRQRSRMVGAFAQPLVFWLLLGGGFNSSFRPPGAAEGTSYWGIFIPELSS